MRFKFEYDNNKILMTDLKHNLKLLFIKFNKNGFRITGYETHPALLINNKNIHQISNIKLKDDNSTTLRLVGYIKNNKITQLQFKNSDLPNEININTANEFIYDIIHFNNHKNHHNN